MLLAANMRPFTFSIASLALAGCYASHGRPMPAPDAGAVPDAPTCDPASRLPCARRASPCDTLVLEEAECVGLVWQCREGAAPYARPWADDHCLPLRDAPLFADGVHESPVPVPIGDSCTWVFPYADASGSVQLLGVASATSCTTLGAPREPIDGPHDPGTYVNVQAAIGTAEGTRVLSRAWAFDASSYGGVRSLGVQLGRVEGDLLAFDGALVFADVDLGDAALVEGDLVYAYGHVPGATGLEADMMVGRAPLASIDDRSAWTVLGTGGWGVGDPLAVFGSGPHRSAVVHDPRGTGYLHVYAAGFGRELRLHTAAAPEGPWSSSTLLAPCELPPDDPGAYCAGPQVHRELIDPMDPGAIVVSYSVGSTSEDQDARRAADPDAYWPRIVRLRLP